MLSHTRFWESSKAGRAFFTLSGNILFNNSKLSHALNKVTLAEYKNLGGTDTLHLVNLKNDRAYIGLYETFVTPSLTARLVYFHQALMSASVFWQSKTLAGIVSSMAG